MKFIRRILAGLAVIALAFKGVASFLSWVERQDDQPAEAWLDEEELDAIQKRLDAIQGVSKAETAKLHQLESYRDRLIADDAAFTKMIEQYPDMDIQNMRTLIRNARKEKETNKPPKAYREIFRVLKDMGI